MIQVIIHSNSKVWSILDLEISKNLIQNGQFWSAFLDLNLVWKRNEK